MKKEWTLKQFVRLALVGLLALCMASSVAQAECSLSVGWEPWEPYQYKEGETLTGLDVELVSAIFTRAGCTLTFVEAPWARLLNLVEHGKVALAMGASHNQEREAYAYFSKPYRSESMRLFVRKGEAANFTFNTLNELAKTPFKLGVIRGYYYGETFKELMNNADFKKQVLEADGEEENYTKLIKGRIDGFVSDPFVTTSGLRKAGISDQIEMHQAVIHDNDIYVIFSKKATSQEQVAQFNQALEAMKADGIYQKIIDKYLQQ